MATIIKVKMGKQTIKIKKERYYHNDRVCLAGYIGRQDDYYAVFTTNIELAPCKANQAYIDTNNVKPDDYLALMENKIIGSQILGYVTSGFCSYPLHEVLI